MLEGSEATTISVSTDQTVLYISPYRPEEVEDARFALDQKGAMIEVFQNAIQRDPDFENFYSSILTVASENQLVVSFVGRDLLALIGDEDALGDVIERFGDQYNCNLGPAGDMQEAIEDAAALGDEIAAEGGWEKPGYLN